jgi:hypothetical protein
MIDPASTLVVSSVCFVVAFTIRACPPWSKR